MLFDNTKSENLISITQYYNIKPKLRYFWIAAPWQRPQGAADPCFLLLLCAQPRASITKFNKIPPNSAKICQTVQNFAKF